MRQLVIVCASILSSAGSAYAAPSAGPPTKVVVDGTEPLRPSTKFTADDAARRRPGFQPSKSYTTRDGRTITGQQYLDIANRMQAAAEKGGCSLGTAGTCNFQHAGAKLSASELDHAAVVAAHTRVPKHMPAKTPASTPEVPAKSPLGFSWNKQWGKTSTAAAYVGAEFGTGGGSRSSTCGGAAYAGVYLFDYKKEVIRLEGEASSAGSTINGSAELLVMGDSVWSKSGSFSADKLSFEKSFTVKKTFSYWGLVSLTVGAKATANAYVSAAISGTAKPDDYGCTLTVTPGVKATTSATAQVSVLGYGDISAAAVGVEADLTLADVSIPIHATAEAKATSSGSTVDFSESLDAELKSTLLKGKLDVYFSTVIPLDGEKIWDWDKNTFRFTLLDFEGTTYTTSLFKMSQTQKL